MNIQIIINSYSQIRSNTIRIIPRTTKIFGDLFKAFQLLPDRWKIPFSVEKSLDFRGFYHVTRTNRKQLCFIWRPSKNNISAKMIWNGLISGTQEIILSKTYEVNWSF